MGKKYRYYRCKHSIMVIIFGTNPRLFRNDYKNKKQCSRKDSGNRPGKPGTETYQGGKYYGNDRTAQHDSDEH